MAVADDYMKQRNYQAAIAHYLAAKVLAPERPGPYRALGMAYVLANQCKEAIPVLEEYLRRKPDDPRPEAVEALRRCRGGRTPPPPRRTKGTVRVTSDPSGAEVRIDDERGQLLGYTPFDSDDLPPGSHQIYLSRAGYRATSGEVRVEAGVMSTLHVPLSPMPRVISPPPVPRENDREALERRKREAWEHAQGEALRQNEEQLRVLYERDKVEICGSGPEYQFCDVNSRITENEFVRRYKKVTGRKDLDYALKMRNNISTAVWATIGLAGVGIMAYGLATLDSKCTMMDSMKSECQTTGGMFDPSKSIRNKTSEVLAYTGGGVHIGASLIYILYGGLKPDGKTTDHKITEYDARLIVDRYNRALMHKIRSGNAAPTESYLPPREPPQRSVRVVPYIGAGGVGVVGIF
jgi:hypothetical protein